MKLYRCWQHSILLLFGIVVNLIFDLHAQGHSIRFQHLTIEQGLSQNSAYSMIQDNNGFMWIGTETALNKYDGYKITVYEYEEGNPNSLTNSFVLTMCKVRSGVLWIGTESGLNRFDPTKDQFSRYLNDPNNPNSLSNNRVLSICEDTFGMLWIGTESGLNKFDREKKRFICYQTYPDNPNSLSHNVIKSIHEDKSGTLWIGTYDGGLNKFDREKERFIHYKNDPDDPTSLSDNHVLSIYEDRSKILWIGTEHGGLNQFDREKERFIHYKNVPYDPNSLSDNHVNVIHEDKSGVLWIGTNDGGLNKFDREKKKFVRYQNNLDNPTSLSDNRVFSICEDKDGGLWFGTHSGGINIFNKETQKFIHYQTDPDNSNSLSYNGIRPIYEDRYGILWIGTDGGGLNKFDRKRGRFTHYKHNPRDRHSLSDNKVFAICEDKAGVFWIGTHGGGLNKFNRETGRFTHYKFNPDNPHSLSNDKVRGICEDKLGVLWIGTNGGGLNKLNREKKQFVHYKFDPNDPHSLSNDRIFCIYEDRSGVLWIGTFGGGLNKFNREKEQFIHYQSDTTDLNSLNNDYILSVYEDLSGMLWVGTIGGLNKFSRAKKTFTHFTKKDGLPDNVIYDILEDDKGNLWMSTNRGISKFNPKTGEFKNYDVKDGLQSNEFNTGTGHKNKSGEMFFGGINGFNAFFPDSIRDNPHVPSIVITDFQIFNKQVPIGKTADGRSILEKAITETKEIVLSYKDNVFSFEFAALHYVSPDQNQYAYMMEGLEKDWNYVGSSRRYVTYTGLPPGDYFFKVKGSNNDGVWNEEGTSLELTIIPPFWKTWWFYTICAIIIVASAIVAYRYQVEQLKKQKEEEERRKAIENFSQILEQGSAAVYRRNFDSDDYEYMGEAIEDITGYRPGEFSLSFWDKIVTTTEMGGEMAGLKFKEVYRRVQEGLADRWVSDFQFRTKTGDLRWLRDMSIALRDESNYCYGCLGIMFDITDRKVAEQELARTSEELRLSSEELRMRNEEMETDLNMAREIQTAFLAKHFTHFPQEIKEDQYALQFSHLYLPTSTLAGDFFDILPISDHEVGVLICDVMGHGARASLLTFYLRGLIQELMPIAADTNTFMARLNDGLNSLMSRFYTGIFATAFYCVSNIKTGTIRFTDAGHPMPYILRRSKGIAEKLQSGERRIDPAIGLHKKFTYSVYETTMADDDIVFLFTDGLYEVEGTDGQMFGSKRLLDTVQSKLTTPPDQLLEGVLQEINKFGDSEELKDDVCMVAMYVQHGSA